MKTASLLRLPEPTPGPVLLQNDEQRCLELKQTLARLLLSERDNHIAQGEVLFKLWKERSKRSKLKVDPKGTFKKDLEDIGGISYDTANRRINLFLGVAAGEIAREGGIVVPEHRLQNARNAAWEVEDLDIQRAKEAKQQADEKAENITRAIHEEHARRKKQQGGRKAKRASGQLPFTVSIYNRSEEQQKKFKEAYEFLGRIASSKVIYEMILLAAKRKWENAQNAQNAIEESHAQIEI